MDLTWMDWGITGVFHNPNNLKQGLDVLLQFIFWFTVPIDALLVFISWRVMVSENNMWSSQKNRWKAMWASLLFLPIYFILFFFWAVFLANLGIGWWIGVGLGTVIVLIIFTPEIYTPIFSRLISYYSRKEKIQNANLAYIKIKNQI